MINLFDNEVRYSIFKFLDNLFEPVLVVTSQDLIYYNKQAEKEFELLKPENQKHFFSDNFQLNKKNLELIENAFLQDTFSENFIFISQSELFKEYRIRINVINIQDTLFAIISFNSYIEKITRAMYQIAKLVNSNIELNELFKEIHLIIDSVIDAKNFFIALYDENKNIISFPYFNDEVDEEFTIIDARDSGSLTADVIRTGKPLLIKKEAMKEIYSDDKDAWGTLSEVWLGVPLHIGNKIIGVIALQSYNDPNMYKIEDARLLEPLAEQIAIVIGKKISDDELKYSEEKFKLAFLTSPDAIAINRLKDGMYIEINDGFTKLTEFTKEDIKGRTSFDINIWSDFSDRDELIKGLERDGFYKNLKAKFKLKNGKIKNALMSASIIHLNNEANILSITRDIDELENARAEIEKLNIELEQRVLERTSQYHDAVEELRYEVDKRIFIQKELERYQLELADSLENEKKSNFLKSRFISMVSHEYRTPLTIIYTSAELLEKFYAMQDSSKHQRQLDRIKQSVQNMTQLLDDVLFMGKSENNRIKTSFEIINLTEFVYTVIEEMKVIAYDINEFTYDYYDEQIWIETDKRLISQILTNLLSNAIKYSRIGSSIEIEIKNFKDFIQISITDYGIGISINDTDLVYDHFYRGGNVGTISGTGLGLSIVKRCIDALKGSISFTSEFNVGTTFYIKLPKKI